MFDGAERGGLGESGAPRFLRGVERVFGFHFDFDVREFPEARVYDSCGALADENFRAALYDVGEETALSGGGAFAEVGELALAAITIRDTVFLERAEEAGGLCGGADGGTEFHQGLVEVGAVSKFGFFASVY